MSKTEWMDRFRARLMELQPLASAFDASGEAIDAYFDLRDLVPERAAETYASKDGSFREEGS